MSEHAQRTGMSKRMQEYKEPSCTMDHVHVHVFTPSTYWVLKVNIGEGSGKNEHLLGISNSLKHLLGIRWDKKRLEELPVYKSSNLVLYGWVACGSTTSEPAACMPHRGSTYYKPGDCWDNVKTRHTCKPTWCFVLLAASPTAAYAFVSISVLASVLVKKNSLIASPKSHSLSRMSAVNRMFSGLMSLQQAGKKQSVTQRFMVVIGAAHGKGQNKAAFQAKRRLPCMCVQWATTC